MGSKIVVGAAVVLLVNGVPYGVVSDFQWASSTPSKELRGLDTIETLELIPTSAGCSGTIGLYRQVGSGGLEGIGVTAPFGSLAALKYCSIILLDRRADMLLFSADRVRFEGETWQVATKGVMRGQASFKALSWSNECRSAGH
jgi:hypothetical protein